MKAIYAIDANINYNRYTKMLMEGKCIDLYISRKMMKWCMYFCQLSEMNASFVDIDNLKVKKM